MEEKSILIQRKYGAVRLRLAEIMDIFEGGWQ